MTRYNINLHEAVYSLSDALDLVGVTHIHHGKRVAYMAAECGKYLKWDGARLDDLFHAAILHDCGVSKTTVHARLTQFEWEEEANHCDIGAALLNSCSLLSKFSDVIKYHHTHWSILKDMDLPDEIKLSANCIYMVDRVDILTLANSIDQSNILLGKEAVEQKIFDKRGDWFCPELVDTFLKVSRSEAFWFCLENEHISGYTATWMSHDQEREVDFDELRSLVYLFSCVVDAKSSFTKEHSDGVAKLAKYIGELFHLSERNCEMLELAGLLHDIGKLRVPDEYLEKPSKLTKEEYAIIQRHSFDTYNILKNMKGIKEIALWASQHHERIDGSGYPYHLDEINMSLETRIIAVADVFQALAQKRPYRDQMTVDEIITILNQQVKDKKLDSSVVSIIEKNLSDCWKAAVLMN